MRQRDRLIVNSLSSVSARVVTMVTQFIIVPFAIGVLGRDQYGTWVIVGQIFAYTALLDMGLRSAIAKEVAGGLARNEPDRVNHQVNTAAGYYTVGGMAIVLLTGVVCYFFPDWFHVPAEYRTAARLMVLVSGLTLACAFPQNAYSAVVSGLQRYDVIAGSNILANVLRLLLVLLLLKQCGPGTGLILLAVAGGGTYLLGAMIRTLTALRLCPPVRFKPWRAKRDLLPGLLSFGINSVIYMMAVQVAMQLAQIVVGARMGADKAADLNVAGTFILAAHTFIVAFGMSARVVVSRYDGEGNDAMLRHLLMRSTRYSAFLAFTGLAVLWVYSDVLFRLWIGDQYDTSDGQASLNSVVYTCRLLICGYGLFWLSLPAYNVVNGIGRHRLPARVALATGVVSMVLVAVLASPRAGIERVAWGIVLPMVPAWGIIVPWYCCRQTQQPIGAYVWEGFGIPLLGVLPAGIIGRLWNDYAVADSWAALILQLIVCGLTLLVSGACLVLEKDDRTSMLESLKRLLSVISRR